MAHPKKDEWLAALPKATAKSLDKLLSDPKRSAKKLSTAFVKALQEAGYPYWATFDISKLIDLRDGRARGLMPLPSDLTPAQRALAELCAYEDDVGLYFFDSNKWEVFCIPETGANRRRWLGLTPGGVLDQPMDYEIGGVAKSVPCWYAIQRAMYADCRVTDFFKQLPIRRRLELLGGTYPAAYGLGSLESFVDLTALQNEGAEWAPAYADYLLTFESASWRRWVPIRIVLFLALARAKVPIEERWEPLFPLRGQPVWHATLRECIAAVAPARREATLLAAMGTDELFDTMAGARALLEDVPSKRVTETLLKRAGADGLAALLGELDTLGARHAGIREAVDAYRAKQSKSSFDLVCTPPVKPVSVDELSAMQQKQLRAFGRAYDGDDRTAKARLDSEKDMEDGSFAGFLELVTFLDAKTRKPLFEGFLLIDSGSIFRAGTTKDVAGIVQGGLDQCKDPALHTALERALATRPR